MRNDDLDRVVPLDQLDDFKVAEGDPDVRGWDVVASDGRRIGEVDQLLVDTAAMKVRYLDVDLDNELGAGTDRHVLIPIGYARLDERADRVIVDNLATGDIVGLPEYNQGPLTRDFEADLRQRFDTAYTGTPGMEAEGADRYGEFYSHDLYDDTRFFGARRGEQY
ncbi:MAG TPA: PRC-barrel domain-containing protein [Longimicrobiaceae bacterium]|nr:PRC-barrel domain-containing protein [Longimicrobiaceae bacterium]